MYVIVPQLRIPVPNIVRIRVENVRDCAAVRKCFGPEYCRTLKTLFNYDTNENLFILGISLNQSNVRLILPHITS